MGTYPVSGATVPPDFPTGDIASTPGASFVAQPLAAGFAYVARFNADRDRSIVSTNFVVTAADTADNPVEIGLYSGDGNTLLATTGLLAGGRLNATGQMNSPLVVQVTAGTPYYGAILVPTITTSLSLVMQALGTTLSGSLPGAAPPLLLGARKGALASLPANLAGFAVYPFAPALFLRSS